MNTIGRLMFASDDALWLWTPRGLSRFDGREFLNLRREIGLPTGWLPGAVHLDNKGKFWIGTSRGLLRYDPATEGPAIPFTSPGNLTNDVAEFAGTADGAIWWRNAGTTLVRYDGVQEVAFTNLWRNDPSWLNLVGRHIAASGKYLWASGPGAALTRFD